MLNEVADSSILAIENFKRNVDAAALDRAVKMLADANSIHVVGYRQASWIAACLFDGLVQLGCRCHRIEEPANLAQRVVSALGASDLLLAVCLSDDDDSAVRVATAAQAKEIPVLAVAHRGDHLLAGASNLFMALPASPESRFEPWGAHMTFAQVLLLRIGEAAGGVVELITWTRPEASRRCRSKSCQATNAMSLGLLAPLPGPRTARLPW